MSDKSNDENKKEESQTSAADGESQSPIVTRGKLTVTSERELYINMTKEEKRKLYKCGKKFKQLEDIATWQHFYQENKKRLKKSVSKKRQNALYEVNAEINERVSIWRGDITTLEIDAITNAANSSLLGGGGVDGAIHSAAGKKLVQECITLNGCDTGDAKITAGYKLPAKYVIHTVGPIGEKKDLLYKAYSSVLSVLEKNHLASIAIPCISTGIYAYPNEKAAVVALETVRKFLEKNDTYKKIDRVIFCLFMPKDVAIYEELMQVYFPVGDSSQLDDNDVEMEIKDEKVGKNKEDMDKKKMTMDKEKGDEKKDSKNEKMETDGKESVSKMEVEEKLKAGDITKELKAEKATEENMDTEENGAEQDGKVDEGLRKDSKVKEASTKVEKMDTDTSTCNSVNDDQVKTETENSLKSQDSISSKSKGDEKSDTCSSKSKTEKQAAGTELGKMSNEKSSEEQTAEEKEVTEGSDSSRSGSVITRKTLKHAENADSNPKVKKQAKV
nr:O-acetyl-ADP-ribose deacetylase MACROD2-like isoform X2 [Crassostrea virginica]